MNPSDGYILYIVNPKSGASSGKLACRGLCRYWVQKRFDVHMRLTNSLDHAGQLAAEAVRDAGCMLVAAAGGDGTLREVARGLQGSPKPLLVVPCGTENVLANELGLDRGLASLVRAFESGAVRFLDLGAANGRCFTSIAGFGFDAAVVERVHRRRTGHINHFDYIDPLWRTFWSYRFPPIRVELDGQEIFDGRGLVFVGNISRYAIGLQILHYADFSDGLLDVCIYKCAGRAHLVKHSVLTILKHHANCRDVIYRQGKEVAVSSPVKVRTQIDGDPGPFLPIRIAVVPHAVQCLIPAGARPGGLRRRVVRWLKK
jgi:diacylglycerol kinase (ATP)